MSAAANVEREIAHYFARVMRPSCDCVRFIREVRAENNVLACLQCGAPLLSVKERSR
jgi:hypothetical protein